MDRSDPFPCARATGIDDARQSGRHHQRRSRLVLRRHDAARSRHGRNRVRSRLGRGDLPSGALRARQSCHRLDDVRSYGARGCRPGHRLPDRPVRPGLVSALSVAVSCQWRMAGLGVGARRAVADRPRRGLAAGPDRPVPRAGGALWPDQRFGLAILRETAHGPGRNSADRPHHRRRLPGARHCHHARWRGLVGALSLQVVQPLARP